MFPAFTRLECTFLNLARCVDRAHEMMRMARFVVQYGVTNRTINYGSAG
jgi:hypothetical protein